MQMMFIGATHEVTGSCTYIEACGKKLLVDFGMEQGRDVYENAKIPCPPSEIDYVLLTHAHIDHSGLLPLLYAGGFCGEIHSTIATANLCDIMLRDSAHIQMFEAEWRNRKGKRSGQDEFVPLYDLNDAAGAIQCFVGHNYDEKIELCEGIAIRYVDAGHLLGSSSIEVWLTEDEQTKKIVFSGDIGNTNQPLIRDPQYINEADYVVMESTYGDRDHDKPGEYVQAFADIIDKTFKRGGSVVVPSFAVGRTQELLYFIKQIKEQKLCANCDFKVYVDSPLAIEATSVFERNKSQCFDAEAMEYVNRGINPIRFDGLEIATTSDESKAINFDNSQKIIISASGMCDAGRIKHHLKHNLWKKENTIMFAGYQAANTLGRSLIDGAKSVKLFGEEINVCAEIVRFPGLSGHADRTGLLKWISAYDKKPQRVFVVHGESSVSDAFVAQLKDEFKLEAYAPFSGTEFDMLANEFIFEAQPKEIEHKSDEMHGQSTVYTRLCAAADRLNKLIKKSEGRTNKDLAKLADRINEVCDKWE